jgi:threonine synthase
MQKKYKIKCFLCSGFKENKICNHDLDYGHLDYIYTSNNKYKIRKFFEKNNLLYLDDILPLKKKYDYPLPELVIKNFHKIDKKFNNRIHFIIDYFNFSGSFKDRASLISCLFAKEKGYKEIVLASSGNAAISTATFSNMLGLKTTVFLPSFVSNHKKKT